MSDEATSGSVSRAELQERYSAVVRRALNVLYATTPNKLLQEAAEELGELRDVVRQIKVWANSQGHDIADAMLGCQCVLEALRLESLMWMALRAERPHDAWHHFVEAEENAALALRTPAGASMEQEFQGRYVAIEKVVFPSMMFQSAGFNHDGGRCTICDQKMSQCSHIKGVIYAGQVCAESGFEFFEADHVAIVDHPMDKHCYIHKYSPDGGRTWFDRMTTEETTSDMDSSKAEPDQFLTESTAMTTRLPVGAKL